MCKTIGRPPEYKNVEDMQKKIDEYFADCDGHILIDDEGHAITDKEGNPVIVGKKPYTITGLALALGFASRQALLNYQGKRAFYDTVTRAKMRCQEFAETMLYDKNGSRGAQFSLDHNFGWSKDGADAGGNVQGVVMIPAVITGDSQ